MGTLPGCPTWQNGAVRLELFIYYNRVVQTEERKHNYNLVMVLDLEYVERLFVMVSCFIKILLIEIILHSL